MGNVWESGYDVPFKSPGLTLPEMGTLKTKGEERHVKLVGSRSEVAEVGK